MLLLLLLLRAGRAMWAWNGVVSLSPSAGSPGGCCDGARAADGARIAAATLLAALLPGLALCLLHRVPKRCALLKHQSPSRAGRQPRGSLCAG